MPFGWSPSVRQPGKSSRRVAARTRLRVETLEERCLLASAVAPTASIGFGGQSALAAIGSLGQVMDQYHNRLLVYEDVGSGGNHFLVPCAIGDDFSLLNIDVANTIQPHSGATSIRADFRNDFLSTNSGGYVLQNGVYSEFDSQPQCNAGDLPNAGVDLTGSFKLTFWARGERGGERIEFFLGGVGRDVITGAVTAPFPDTTARFPEPGTAVTTLTTAWQQFTIFVTGVNLGFIQGGFGWNIRSSENPLPPAYPLGGATFYVDDIQYDLDTGALQRKLNQPHFLRSYETQPFQSQPAPTGDFDLRYRNAAFTYDNAQAMLAFLANGSADGLRRARLVADAFLYATENDRTFTDGRIRNVYSAGDIALPSGWYPRGRGGSVLTNPPAPGYFDVTTGAYVDFWIQTDSVSAVDTGDNAWTMIAFLGLYRRTGEQAYLEAARLMGDFIRSMRNDTGTYQGYLGGIDRAELPTATVRRWASADHNLAVHAAFNTMFQITREPVWQDGAEHARRFIEAMWDTRAGLTTTNCYLSGTIDPATRDDRAGQLHVQTQAWSVLALTNGRTVHPEVFACAERNQLTTSDGFTGFDYNEDKDGVWFEGTAHMAATYAFDDRTVAEFYRQELRRAQATAPFGDADGIAAASHDGLTTGTSFLYMRRPHVGATAWNVFAQLEVNPFYQAGQQESYAIVNDNSSLWKYNPALPVGNWTRISGGAFAAISATRNAAGQSVVFAVVQSDRSLWMHDPSFNTSRPLEDRWQLVSPGRFEAITATQNAAGAAVVYGIVAGNRSLWLNDPAFRPGAVPQDRWQLISTRSVFAVDSTRNATNDPVVYAIMADGRSLWYHDPTFNPSRPISERWQLASPGAFEAISATRSVTNQPIVYAIVTGNRSLWVNDGDIAVPLTERWRLLSAAPFLAIAAGRKANRDPFVYAIVATDCSLWKNDPAFPGNSWQRVSGASFTAVSADLENQVVALASDASMWEGQPDSFTELSAAGSIKVVAATR